MMIEKTFMMGGKGLYTLVSEKIIALNYGRINSTTAIQYGILVAVPQFSDRVRSRFPAWETRIRVR
jgi:hypothetical protein